MALPAPKPDERYTWDNYLTWPDDERWELIGGKAYAMSPGPSRRHQDIVLGLGAELRAHFANRPCKPYIAPLDLKLSDEDVVQPDLMVVCEPEQDERYVKSPPSLVVEILSPSSLRHDRERKTKLYGKHGIKEYWIVTPHPSLVEIYLLHDQRYYLWNAFGPEDTLTSPSFPDLKIDLSGVFNFPLTDEEIRETGEPYRANATIH